jgi:hypothetical protein
MAKMAIPPQCRALLARSRATGYPATSSRKALRPSASLM